MKIIETNYSDDFLSVPTEASIDYLLKRDKDEITTNYNYVDIYIGSCIKYYGVEKTQKIINNYISEENFFVCQHIDIKYLNFGTSKVFTPHATKTKYISIPHYSMNVENLTINRDIFFSFIGSTNTHPSRRKLVDMYPNTCFSSGVHWGIDNSIEKTKKENIINKFKELSNRSVFSLCPRGTGVSSIRLFETMGMGSIPVIIADNFQKPLENILNWEEFSITIKEKDICNIPEILNKYNGEQIDTMCNKTIDIYNKYFNNDNLHKSIILNI